MKAVLAIGAHPDDIEIGCGGRLAQLRKEGFRLALVIVTTGEEGSLHEAGAQLAKRRREEAMAAAHVLGAQSIDFPDLPDGSTAFTKEDKVRLTKLIREHKPEIVFTHASHDSFSDHALVHRLTLDAIAIAGGPWFPAAGLTPHRVSRVYGYEVWNPIPSPGLICEISAEMEIKLKALRQHRSQVEGIDYLHAVKGLAAYRGALGTTRAGPGSYAEAFEVLRAES